MKRRSFLGAGVAALAPLPSLAAQDEMKAIDALYDSWSAARLKFEHLCDLVEDNEDLAAAWEASTQSEKQAKRALLQHRDQTIEAVRLRARYINIMVERDHVGSDFGDFSEEMSLLVKSLF